MKKIWMLLLTFSLIVGAISFIFINNQGYCIDNMSCSQKQFTQTWSIVSYNETELKNAISKGDNVALLFEAPRCANCKLLKEDLLVKGIPAGATLLIADFDQATDLRKKYWVKNLHTIVLIDHHLNLITKDESGEYQNLINLLQ